MSADTPRPPRPPLWTGRPVHAGPAGAGGCARCHEIQQLLAQTSGAPAALACAECQGAAPDAAARPRN
ncbi:MAG: hypothetical protein QM702_05615 [Rubrivivax sp.]